MSSMQPHFEYAIEVEQAIREKKAILALESTLITHGLPYPQNIETAMALLQIAKEHEVTPAIIAIIRGKVKIGLSYAELQFLVQDKSIQKASSRDIPYLISQGLSASTTVASTIYCADFAGIKVCATGGIGGVHRGGDQDISADLVELARTPLAVVCSGAKAILDIPKTLEYLETFGVPIVGFRTDYFPAFYSKHTNYRLPNRIDNIPALAKLIKTHWQLGLNSSLIIANPIPEDEEIPAETIEPVITAAVKTALEKNISGKEMTPFLLNEVAHATSGKSMNANITLIKNNVKIGAMLAHAVMHL